MSSRAGAAADGTPIRSLALRAPAKINLGLRILGIRPDGYHLLESLFVPVDRADDVRIQVAPANGIAEVRLDLEQHVLVEEMKRVPQPLGRRGVG